MSIKAIIFDLDGTLLDTLNDIAHAANRALSLHGFPTHPTDDYRIFIGNGALKLFERALPESHRSEYMIEACCNEFKKDYRQNWHAQTSVYEGIADMLDALCARNLRLSILSNKPHEFTLKCVDTFLPEWPFEIVMGQQNGIAIKPDPAGALMIADRMGISPSDFLYLGDSDVDMKTATAAGMFAAGALWGFRTKEELIENGARALLYHPKELLALLE